MSYQPKTYRKQGGDEFVVASGGKITVESGGQISQASTAITATVGGGTTGLIPATASMVVVTSSVATKQITLPTNVVGKVIRIVVTANGCELIAADAGAKVNDVVVGATNELALAADSHFIAECISSTEWIVRGFTKLGADIAALVPDAL